MWRVLLIDDAQECRVLVEKALGGSYDLSWEKTLTAAFLALKNKSFDLILLDVGLPDGDGFQFCARLQQEDLTRRIPIILLTGKTGVSNKVLGFSVGADDYMEKPVDPLELRARVESKLKKLKANQKADAMLVKGRLQINLENLTVHLKDDNSLKEISLTPIEIKLLRYLASQEGRVLSREQLMTNVWGQNVAVTERTVDKHISYLRQKLGTCAVYIETVAGFGYTFTSSTAEKKAA